MRQIVGSIEGEYRRYKTLGEAAIEQVTDEQLSQVTSSGGNSIASLVWHISGNLASRFTDFLQSDGEKPWRDRDAEFLHRIVPRAELREKWEKGWTVLFRSLADLDDEGLHAVVKIRGVPLSVHEALHRSLAHTSYHVGQVVFLAKAFRGGEWRYLSIPPGGSAAYNENPVAEKPAPPKPITTFLVGTVGLTIGFAVIAVRVQDAVISLDDRPPSANAGLVFLGLSVLAGTLWLGRGLVARRQIAAIAAVVLLVGAVAGAGVALALAIDGGVLYSVLMGMGALGLGLLTLQLALNRCQHRSR